MKHHAALNSTQLNSLTIDSKFYKRLEIYGDELECPPAKREARTTEVGQVRVVSDHLAQASV